MAVSGSGVVPFVADASAVTGIDGQPLVYPEPLCVRNTFIDVQITRSPSLDEFLPVRGNSCPYGAELLRSEACDPETPRSMCESLPEGASDCSTVDTMAPSDLERQSSSEGLRIRLSLNEVLRQPVENHEGDTACKVPELELPSIGSAVHHAGQCTPCAFLHTRACQIGSACEFCHLCGPEARKQRKKEKRAYFGALKHMRKLMKAGTLPAGVEPVVALVRDGKRV